MQKTKGKSIHSHVGNNLFPRWERFIPTLGITSFLVENYVLGFCYVLKGTEVSPKALTLRKLLINLHFHSFNRTFAPENK